MKPAHEPCEVTGKPCNWMSEDECDEDGNLIAWDDFCIDCGQWRDWNKDVCQDVAS